jgi:hypothetical protein
MNESCTVSEMVEERLVLYVDYPGRRPEAHLWELGLHDAGWRTVELVRHPLPAATKLRDYATALLEREPTCADATGVVAYCAAAPLAAEVANQLAARTGVPLPLVFLDPSRCEQHHLTRGYATVVEQIDSGTDTNERRPHLDVLEGLHDPVAMGEAFATDLEARVRAALLSAGFADHEMEASKGPVASVYLDWLNYLLAVHHRGDVVATGPVLNLLSASHPADTAWLGVSARDTLRVECTRAELARRSESIDLIVDFLASHAAISEGAMA